VGSLRGAQSAGSRNAGAELDAIHEREMRDLGIVRVTDEIPSPVIRTKNAAAEIEQVEAHSNTIIRVPDVVTKFSQALSGETLLADSDWLVIGGIRLNQDSTIKTPLGVPMLKVRLESLNGVVDDGSIYPVMIKRGHDDEIVKVMIDFSERLDYANLSEKSFTKEETIATMQGLIEKGLMKPK
jgi:hypothetical protein